MPKWTRVLVQATASVFRGENTTGAEEGPDARDALLCERRYPRDETSYFPLPSHRMATTARMTRMAHMRNVST